ncbi:TetR/AcrR family transcriptional regulator [Azospirillum griseum]|uniref:TetR/AcrR family transcriptional regulator n=1 Tax=Azospirillum griseum TaxID=2496639 RepID=UPI0013154E99|nr:TetR/AcrR family transcriptional regulator [Azospirillum griseum]
MRKPRRPHSSDATIKDFLDAAETLFAKHGYEGTTIRAITDAAGANLGTIHYYWGSKKALFKAVCERRLRPITDERLRLFDQCVARSVDGVPILREVVEATLMPVLSSYNPRDTGSSVFGELMVRTLTDPAPEVREVMEQLFDEVSIRCIRLLRQCCPHLDDESFYWRLHGVFGLTQYSYSGRSRIVHLSYGRFLGTDLDMGLRELVQFVVSGLSAPMTTPDTATTQHRRRPPH